MREHFTAALSTWLPVEALVPHAESLWLVAVLVTFAAGLLLVARAGLDLRPAFWAGICGLMGGLVFGRLWLVYLDGQPVVGPLLADLLQGEKSVMGAAVGALAGGGLWLRLARQRALDYIDAAVPAAFLGYALARVGCLLAGCCFGTPTDLPWGIHYPAGSDPYLAEIRAGLIEPVAAQSLAVHPIPLYHALLALVLCRFAFKARGLRGRPVAIALMGYGVGRFLLEFLRGDAIPTALGLSVAQLSSAGFVIAGLMFWQFTRSRGMMLSGATARASTG